VRFFRALTPPYDSHRSSSLHPHSLPTFILLECVLAYLTPAAARALLTSLASSFPTAVLLLYDPTRPDDAFGQQMLRSLAAAGHPFLGVEEVATPQLHAARLRSAGWARAHAADLGRVQASVLDAADVRRAERLEPLDEIEEWGLFQRHYAMAMGVNDKEARHGVAPP